MNDKVIDKIQKLLALAESSNVNEAASAAARAQELMTKHQIELADLQALTPGLELEEIVNAELFSEKSMINWKVALAAGIAKANDCSVYSARYKNARNKLVEVKSNFVGRKSALETVRYFYGYLVNQVNFLASQVRGPDVDRAYLNAFRLGAVAKITTRLLAARDAAKVGASGSALAVINKDSERVQAVLDKMNLKSGASPSIKDTEGFAAGIRAGDTVKLDKSGPALQSGPSGHLPG